MATPTRSEIEASLIDLLDIVETVRAEIDTNVVSLYDHAQQALEGDHLVPRGATAIQAMRARHSACVDGDIHRLLWEAVLHEYGKFIDSPGTGRDLARVRRDVYDYMHANSLTVKSRNITYATGSAGGSNVGNGSISRCTTDENGYKLEGCRVETKKLKCVASQVTGAQKHAEQFDLYGENSSIDWLDWVNHGSGRRRTIFSHHAGAGDGGSLLRNCAFQDYLAGGSTTTMFPGWTLGDTADFDVDASIVYRGIPGSSENVTGGVTVRSLKFADNGTCSQKLADAGVDVDRYTPYFLRVMLRRQSSCDGTFTLRLGSKTATQDVSSLTNDTWTEVLIAVGQNNWPSQWEEDNADISLELASRTTGTLLAGDVLFAPFDYFDGTYWFIRGGSTAWLLDDTYSFADTGGAEADGIIQYSYGVRAFPGAYFPSTTGTETWADPT